jgi:uroporphyrinogen-III synthase
MLRVAITRAMPDALATADRVRERGAEAVLAPLLVLTPLAFETDTREVQALLFTSANGARAFAGASQSRSIPVLAVGDATAAVARNAGFSDVRSAAGNVETLANLAKVSLDRSKGKLLHVSGSHVAGNLAELLGEAGFDAERRIAYEARSVSTLPTPFEGPLDCVLFHSPRAAMIFLTLGAPSAELLTALCLSPAVAAAAAPTRWASLIVSPSPHEGALLDAGLLG